MLGGVVIVSDSGALLHSARLAPNFGLGPSGESALTLASLLFAIHRNSPAGHALRCYGNANGTLSFREEARDRFLVVSLWAPAAPGDPVAPADAPWEAAFCDRFTAVAAEAFKACSAAALEDVRGGRAPATGAFELAWRPARQAFLQRELADVARDAASAHGLAGPTLAASLELEGPPAAADGRSAAGGAEGASAAAASWLCCPRRREGGAGCEREAPAPPAEGRVLRAALGGGAEGGRPSGETLCEGALADGRQRFVLRLHFAAGGAAGAGGLHGGRWAPRAAALAAAYRGHRALCAEAEAKTGAGAGGGGRSDVLMLAVP